MTLSASSSTLLAGMAGLLFGSLATKAAPQSGALISWQAHAKEIVPTVLREQGDLGGKLFGEAPDPAKTRHYYIAAENVAWCFDPAGANAVCAGHEAIAAASRPYSSLKLHYVQYTDETFTNKVIENPRLGLLGPVLRGVVGENIAVTLLNKTDYPVSMHPHGVKYDKDNEGAYYQPFPGLGSAVGPGARFTYVWRLDESSGPLPNEPSSKCWLYHSHVCGDEESNLGLVGFIIVTDPKRARPDGTPNDVDREMAALFMLFDENYVDPNPLPGDPKASAGEPDEKNVRYAINGRDYDSLPGFEVNEGERVRWYLFGLGSEQDLHTAHWHGLRVVDEGRRRTDVVELLPASMKVADMVADNDGTWLFHCHVAEHMKNGMFARLTVSPKSSPAVNPDPTTAFFGMKDAEQQMWIERVEAVGEAPAAQAARLELQGVVALDGESPRSPSTTTVSLQIGGKTFDFTLDRTGSATAGNSTFRVTNLGPTGWIAGRMQFEAKLALLARQDGTKVSHQAGERSRTIRLPVKVRLGADSFTSYIEAPADLLSE